jgi:hypothetical protein
MIRLRSDRRTAILAAMKASRSQAQSELAPYADRLFRCIQDAVRGYLGEHGWLAYRYSRRTEASIIHDYMVARVKSEFDGEPGVTWVQRRGLFLLIVGNSYLIKLKKHDRRLRTHNISTQLSFDFLSQRQLELPGMPPAATNLHLGYQPGVTLASSTYWITCRDGSYIEWAWPLDDFAPTVLPVEHVAPAPAQRRVRPRIASGEAPAAANGTAE